MLITGFNKFGDLSYNPTELAIGEIGRLTRGWPEGPPMLEVLPTEYVRAGQRMRALVTEFRPAAILGFGVAPSASAFLLERFAINLDESSMPDNAGWAPVGMPIAASGPAAYQSTLPLEALYRTLQDERFPVAYSNHAGTYVCNHVFYVARHAAECGGLTIPCGFIHVPLMIGAPGHNPTYDQSFVNVLRGIRLCIETVRRTLPVSLTSGEQHVS